MNGDCSGKALNQLEQLGGEGGSGSCGGGLVTLEQSLEEPFGGAVTWRAWGAGGDVTWRAMGAGGAVRETIRLLCS